MARLLATLRLLRLLSRREFKSLSSVAANNLFLVFVFLMLGSKREPAFWSTLLFQLVLLVPLLFAISYDTLARIPKVRWKLWPLSRWQQFCLRSISLGLNPGFWIVAVLYTYWVGLGIAVFFALLAVAIQLITILCSNFSRSKHTITPMRLVPQFPGTLGGLIQMEIRQIISSLDFYAALILTVAGCVYRFVAERPDAEAFPLIALLIAISLSTYAQRTFGLYSAGGVARLHLLPVPGWKILATKDIAYLFVSALLTLPVNLGAGMAFSLTALAIGRYPSIGHPNSQQRWRFQGGDLRFGILQIATGTVLTVAAVRVSVWIIAIAALLHIASLWAGQLWWSGSKGFTRELVSERVEN